MLSKTRLIMQNMFDNIREQDYDQNMKFKKQRGSSKSYKTSIVRMWLSYNFWVFFVPLENFLTQMETSSIPEKGCKFNHIHGKIVIHAILIHVHIKMVRILLIFPALWSFIASLSTSSSRSSRQACSSSSVKKSFIIRYPWNRTCPYHFMNIIKSVEMLHIHVSGHSGGGDGGGISNCFWLKSREWKINNPQNKF